MFSVECVLYRTCFACRIGRVGFYQRARSQEIGEKTEREQYLKTKLGACGPSAVQGNAQGEGRKRERKRAREEFIDNQQVTVRGPLEGAYWTRAQMTAYDKAIIKNGTSQTNHEKWHIIQ